MGVPGCGGDLGMPCYAHIYLLEPIYTHGNTFIFRYFIYLDISLLSISVWLADITVYICLCLCVCVCVYLVLGYSLLGECQPGV